ncbi:MAG: hypothetical protein R3A46_14395 [Thermomicrobiales bacterium]
MSMGFLTGVLFARRAGLEGQDALVSGVLGDTFNAASQPVGLILTQQFTQRRADAQQAPPVVVGEAPGRGSGMGATDLAGDFQVIQTSIIAAIAAFDSQKALDEIILVTDNTEAEVRNQRRDGVDDAYRFRHLADAAHQPANEQELGHIDRALGKAINAIGADPLRALSVYKEAASYDDEVDNAIDFFAAYPDTRAQLEKAARAALSIGMYSHDEAENDEDEEQNAAIRRLQEGHRRQQEQIREMRADITDLVTGIEQVLERLKSIESKVDGNQPPDE